MPETPASFSAAFTSSSLNGLTIAVISFMCVFPFRWWPRSEPVRGCARAGVRLLAVLADVEPRVLVLLGHPGADGDVQRLEDGEGDDEGEHDGSPVGERLLAQQL